MDLDKLRDAPENEELPSQLLIKCTGELKIALKTSLGLLKEHYIGVLSWPVVYDSYLVVRVSQNFAEIQEKE